MGLVSARFMMPAQLARCCAGQDVSPGVVGYTVHTIDDRRIGQVEDVLIDDEAMVIAFLVVEPSTAEFIVNQPRLLLPASLCCWDEEGKRVRSRATVDQVQSAPPYDAVTDISEAYERTVFTNFGERPYWPT